MSDINSNSNILKEVVQVHDPVLLNTPQPCPNIPIQSIGNDLHWFFYYYIYFTYFFILEEREKRLSDERVLIAQKLQRKQRLDALVRKRKANLEYLQVIYFILFNNFIKLLFFIYLFYRKYTLEVVTG